jgi:hypothetical protein
MKKWLICICTESPLNGARQVLSKDQFADVGKKAFYQINVEGTHRLAVAFYVGGSNLYYPIP